jgi:hypothetical protein
MVDGVGTIIRNELLVITDKGGKIEGFSYKNKATMQNLSPLAFVADVAP